MKRPSFQFYPADWRKDANLRRCSPAARGVWMDLLCILHDSDQYGVVCWPLKELASAAGASLAHVRELVDKRVLKGCDAGMCEPLIFTPRHGRREGAPVELIATQAGPIWYSSRFVRDEYVRTIRGESSRFGAGDGEAPKAAPKPPLGDGPTSSSSSSSSPSGINTGAPTGLVGLPAADPPYRVPNCPHEDIVLAYAHALPMLPQVAVLSDQRKSHVTARWRAVCADQKFTREQGLEWFTDYFATVAKSPFLTGSGKPDRATGRVWAADFDWLMLPTNFVKVVEGRYIERKAA